MHRRGKAKVLVTRFGAWHQHPRDKSYHLCQACIERAIQTLALSLYDKRTLSVPRFADVATDGEYCSKLTDDCGY